jgi:hypothetical protein
MGDGTADQIVKPSRPVLTRLPCGTGRARNTRLRPFICVYCRQRMALRRDNYFLLPPEHPVEGDYQPTHLACVEAHRRDAEAHPPAGDRELIRALREILSVPRRASSRLARVNPRVVPSAVRHGLALFR